MSGLDLRRRVSMGRREFVWLILRSGKRPSDFITGADY
jgi:hypothetical protein